MSIRRELREGPHRIEYPLVDFFNTVSDFGRAETSHISSELSCSYPTAYKKLRCLSELGVIQCSEGSNPLEWFLSVEHTGAEEPKLDKLTRGKLAALILESIDDTAQQLIDSSSLIQDPPHSVRQWLDDRGMDASESSAEVISRAAVFDFYLKSTLHSLYVPEVEELEPLDVDADHAREFETARNLTGNEGFSPTPPSQLAAEIPESAQRQILSLRSALRAYDQPATVLSTVYECLFTQNARRELGQFATPNRISTLLAEWAVSEDSATVLDPGVGAGMLSSAVVREKTERGDPTPIQDIKAIDIDGLSVSMAAVSLKSIDGAGSPELSIEDFLDLKAYEWTSEGRDQSDPVDAVVSNPPYSRSQLLTEDEKEAVNTQISREAGIELHGKSPLYVYFLIHASQFVKPGGKLGFVIPSGFMQTDFGVGFKQYLKEEFQIEAVVNLDDQEGTFEGVKTTVSLLLLTKKTPQQNHDVTFINLPEWPDYESLTELLDEDFEDSDGPEGYRVDIAQRLLSPEEKWLHYFAPTDTEEITGVSEFSDIATIKRGIATGNNQIFCLTKDDIENHKLPKKYLWPIIRTAKDIPGYEITSEDWLSWHSKGRDVWLLYCYDNEREKVQDPEGVAAYLDYCEKEYDTDRKLLDQRNPWYCVDEREPAPILAKYMSRTGSQFIHNKAGLRTLNNMHNIVPDFEESEEQVKALLAYLNSNIVKQEISKVSRSYSGLEKIELGALKSSPVIDPRDLAADTVQELATLFDELETAERGDGDLSEPIGKIDEILMDILDISVKPSEE
ncbi:class I SAM-dependent DNA methyltransferase [Haloarcula sp. K1]|uniref:HsdM family class I SAM-dependent methyltransferase n=1 Tax=Haloarcula sp. K1 TaxID=1622207 RepID=UPI0007BC574C|nr:N-6 DNA methylase [Haloarcula sp. K1]KZX50138.1 hypothetical protein AV929_20345 [Haloarcula sp. K1]